MPESAQNVALSELGAEKISGGTWRLFIFSAFVFSIMVVGYLGLKFGFRPYLESQIKAVDADIDGLTKSILSTDQEKFTKLYFQLVNLEQILGNHLFSSKFFPFLQESTNKQVQFSNISLNVPQAQVTLGGFAADYKVFAQQLLAFEQNKEKVVHVSTQGASADDKGRVTFQLELKLVPSFFIDQ